jgi:hypothetical protein
MDNLVIRSVKMEDAAAINRIRSMEGDARAYSGPFN